MFNLFGTKKKPDQSGGKGNQQNATSQKGKDDSVLRSIQQLDKQTENLDKRRSLVENRAGNLREQAKAKLKANDKKGARQLLMRVKNYDNQLDQIDKLYSKLSFVRGQLESSNLNREAVGALSAGAEGLKSAKVDQKQADAVMDDLNEQLEDQQDVQDSLNTRLHGELDEMDVSDSMEELEREMQEEEEEARILREPQRSSVVSETATATGYAETSGEATSSGYEKSDKDKARELPSAPTTAPRTQEHADDEDMDEELRRLEAEMEMS